MANGWTRDAWIERLEYLADACRPNNAAQARRLDEMIKEIK